MLLFCADDGLLHITDMSWGRVKHPSELINVGDEIQVKVLKYDNEKERVSLGMKQMHSDPWESVKQVYPIGAKLTGKVVSVAEYGAFIELAEGVEGLIHVSEMSWTKRVKHASQVVNVGDEVNVVVCCAFGCILRLLRGADVDVPAGVCQCIGGQFSFFTITFEIIFHFYEENTRASAIKCSKFFRKPKGFFSDGFFGFRIECHGKLLV